METITKKVIKIEDTKYLDKTKFYVPDITDFRIGYEFQFLEGVKYKKSKDPGKEYDEVYVFLNKTFDDTTFNGINVSEIGQVVFKIQEEENRIRVPYLTDKQIKSSGWKLHKKPNKHSFDNWIMYEKWLTDIIYMLKYDFVTHEASIGIIAKGGIYKPKVIFCNSKTIKDYLFTGTCRCINDLRLIEKMINVKPYI